MKQYGDTEERVSAVRTLNTIVNEMGYTVRSVKKSIPIKKILEKELIFGNLERVHKLPGEIEAIIRLSIDTKDKVNVGIWLIQ